MSAASRPLVPELRALAAPLFAYWAALLIAIGTFSTLILVFEGADGENLVVLSGIAVGSLGGALVGQVAALLRLRTWLVAGAALGTGGAWLVALASVGDPPEPLIPLFIGWFFFPFFLMCGLWSLRVGMGLLATWAPLVFFTGSILVVADQTGSEARWFAGQKWAVWDLFTAPILLVGVALLVAYLATRELHRLHRWRTGHQGPLPAPVPPGRVEGRATPGCGGVLALAALVLVLSVASGLSAPYLWRTGPGGDDNSGHQHPDEPDAPPDPADLPPGDEPTDGDSGALQRTGEQVVEAMRQAATSLLWLLIMLLLALLALLLFGPPLRRTLLLQHLRRPLWPVPPTRRIRNHWRVVTIAVGDLGVHAQPGDTATTLALRAAHRLPQLDPKPLLDCAEVVDRVTFGLGVQPDDTMRARRNAEMAYSAVWDFLGEIDKIKAIYRWV